MIVALEQSFLEHALSDPKLSALVAAGMARHPVSADHSTTGPIEHFIRSTWSRRSEVLTGDIRASTDVGAVRGASAGWRSSVAPVVHEDLSVSKSFRVWVQDEQKE